MRGRSFLLALAAVAGCAEEESKPPPGVPVARGELVAHFRGNVPDGLSGVASVRHQAAPAVAAFHAPDAGLNYEHILGGHSDPLNGFTPRSGAYPLRMTPEGDGVILTRLAAEEPRRVASELTYRVVPPHYIDFDFRATVTDAAEFQPEGYAVFFFASYMETVEANDIRFWGQAGPDDPPGWVSSSAAPGQVGESYQHVDAAPLPYDDSDPNLRINLSVRDWPRYTEPFYFGRAAQGMVYAIMFDDPAVRFTVMRWSAHEARPAWDFGYVARDLQDGDTISFSGRVVWKPFVSAEDIRDEYASWVSGS